jgi:hypothetical protein
MKEKYSKKLAEKGKKEAKNLLKSRVFGIFKKN